MDRNEDNAQIDRKLDIQAWHHRIYKAGLPLHWCDACSASSPQKNSKTVEPQTVLSPRQDVVSVQGVVCFICANLDWDRYLYRSKDGLDTERRLEISSKSLQHSATSVRCTECLIIYSGIRNFAATLTNAEYRRRLFSFDRCYGVEIILRRNKCLRVLVHDTINERGLSQFVLADAGFERLSAGPDGAGGPLIIELDYYGPSCHPLSWDALGPTNHIVSRLTLSVALGFARWWVSYCKKNHDPASCRPGSRSPILPTRVLDVGSASCKVRLIETQGARGRYMTMSHRWGEQMVTTTEANIRAHLQIIPWVVLSNTYRDAIDFTKSLDCRYLWIDSLCIIQDNKDDWEHEAANMANIYSKSYLNIAASQSPERNDGLFNERFRLEGMKLGKSSIEPARVHVGGGSILVRQAPYIAHDHVLGRAHRVTTGHSDIGGIFSPVFERAWVFQERLLAPRTIVFHHEELVWECAKATWCECGEINSSSTPGATGFDELYLKGRLTRLNFNSDGIVYSKEHMFSFWMDVVERYSLLNLTKESDRLPALAGLAQRLSRRFSCRYLAGMWEEDLAGNLLWSRDPWRETWSCDDLTDYYTPTWSWTSIRPRTSSNNIKSFIRYDYIQDYSFKTDSRFELVATRCEYSNPYDHFGRLKYASLELRGAIIEVVLKTYEPLGKDFLTATILHFQAESSYFRGDVGRIPYECSHWKDMWIKAHCLLIGHSWAKNPGSDSFCLGLVLSRKSSGSYFRVGLLALSKLRNSDWFKEANINTVIIE